MRERTAFQVRPSKTLNKTERIARRRRLVPSESQDVTQLLRAWSDGDEAALHRLVPLVESELRRLARACMGRERKDHTLQATALVNEAFLRLADARQVRWQDRAHFIGIAARLMRRVLADQREGVAIRSGAVAPNA